MGSDGTSGSYFTTAAGQTIASVAGRYGRFRAFLVSTDGLATPELGDVQLTHSGTSWSRVTRYVFDDAGNILEVAVTTDGGTTTDVRTYNNLNQLETSTGGWTYQYDLDGNMTGKNNGSAEGNERWELAWNEDARLVQVKKGVYDATPALVNEFTVDYQYDQVGRMLRRDDGTDVTTLRWDGWDLVGETTGLSVTEYLVPNGLIHSFIRGGDLFTVHCDALGSVRMVTNSSGAVVAKFEHSAFGKSLDTSFDMVPGGMPYTWVGTLGVRTDATTGLTWMRNRWYSPTVARFLSRDQIGLRGGTNFYVYAANDPANAIDPTGNFIAPVILGGISSVVVGMAVRSLLGGDPFDTRAIGTDFVLGAAFSGLGVAWSAYKHSRIIATGISDTQALRAATSTTGGNAAVATVNLTGGITGKLPSLSGYSKVRSGLAGLVQPTRVPVMKSVAAGPQKGLWCGERNILEYLLASLPAGFKGAVQIFSEKVPCAGCTGAAGEFKQAFPGIAVTFYHAGQKYVANLFRESAKGAAAGLLQEVPPGTERRELKVGPPPSPHH